MTKKDRAQASKRAKASWKNGPLAKWNKDPRAKAEHIAKAQESWQDGSLAEWAGRC